MDRIGFKDGLIHLSGSGRDESLAPDDRLLVLFDRDLQTGVRYLANGGENDHAAFFYRYAAASLPNIETISIVMEKAALDKRALSALNDLLQSKDQPNHSSVAARFVSDYQTRDKAIIQRSSWQAERIFASPRELVETSQALVVLGRPAASHRQTADPACLTPEPAASRLRQPSYQSFDNKIVETFVNGVSAVSYHRRDEHGEVRPEPPLRGLAAIRHVHDHFGGGRYRSLDLMAVVAMRALPPVDHTIYAKTLVAAAKLSHERYAQIIEAFHNPLTRDPRGRG